MTDTMALPLEHAIPFPLRGIASRVTDDDRTKIVMPGTDRARPAEASLTRALQCAPLVGITRLADVTRLDTIGIPTFQAIRPAAATLTVSQGKGLTETLASVSALMESTELWHAENVAADIFVDTVRNLRPGLTYDPYHDLPLETNCLLHDDLPLEWVIATNLPDGRAVPVPYRLVNLDFREPAGWQPRVFQDSSNGLASGNTFVEAALHALYEVIERDALAREVPRASMGRRFDPYGLDSGPVHELLDRFAAAQVSVDARWVPSPTGLPCVAARIVSPDYQLVAGGYGCHLSTDIATTRALTEAAQSRLTLISGARDDMSGHAYRPVSHMVEAPPGVGPGGEPPSHLLRSAAHRSLLEDLAEVQRRCVGAFTAPPLLYDLAQPEVGIPVVRAIVPGCVLNQGAA